MFFDLYECIFFSPLLFYGGLLQKATTKIATKIRSKYYSAAFATKCSLTLLVDYFKPYF